MNEPHFLTLDDVPQIHAFQISQFGGDSDVLNMVLVESAIAMPRQSFGQQYVHPDLATMAAAYLFHIVGNHAFADGNKRTGLHAAIVFLGLNGVEIDVPADEAELLVLRVADRQHPDGPATKDEVAQFFQRLIREV